ncbi:hypothetical protein ScPMuIL_010839 [Solemya velum]
MEAVRKRRHTPSNTPDGPTEDIETEGEKQLKNLLQKQLDTDVTLHSQLKKQKEFSGAVNYKPAVESLSGVLDLTAYREVEETDSQIHELRQCGLTDGEIQHRLQAGRLDTGRKFRVEPSALAENSREIARKIKQRQNELSLPDKVSGSKTISRHEMDLERSINRRNEKSEFLSNILTNQRPVDTVETLHPDHPMNHVTDILHSLESSVHRHHRRRRKRGGQAETVICGPLERPTYGDEKSPEMFEQSQTKPGSDDTGMRSDDINSCDIAETSVTKISATPDSPGYGIPSVKESNLPIDVSSHCRQTSKDSNVRRILSGEIESIPVDVILKFKLQESQIREMPRFEKYTAGVPNNVLYLKNLAAKVSEEDLVALFSRFQKDGDPNIIYRLLSGRMKGQAFVTFDNCETATEALKLVNGYQLKGKPIIIQYGAKPKNI